MKNFIYLILLIPILISCDKDEIIQDSTSEKYLQALDTLDKSDNYFIGMFNGEILVSTEVYGGSSGTVLSSSNDSIPIQYQIGYDIRRDKSKMNKHVLVGFGFMESKKNLNDNYRFISFNHFIDFFNKKKCKFYDQSQHYSTSSFMSIYYFDFYTTHESVDYSTSSLSNTINYSNSNFTIDCINIIDSNIQAVEIKYSFNCFVYSDFDDEIEILYGKGKSTFEYNP
jgi:hypothetical protein